MGERSSSSSIPKLPGTFRKSFLVVPGRDTDDGSSKLSPSAIAMLLCVSHVFCGLRCCTWRAGGRKGNGYAVVCRGRETRLDNGQFRLSVVGTADLFLLEEVGVFISSEGRYDVK